jgi:RNA polymerase sigma-70 factor (ECF subfamily)
MGVVTARGAQQTVGRERAEARFERLYAQHGRSVLAYAVRRSSDPQDAADVVAETFLVAWRRLHEVPGGQDARLWLYGVARHVLSNQHRSERRRERLAERLGQELSLALDALPRPDVATGAVRAALERLGPEDREIVRLAGWEELTPREIAKVLGISQVSARSRLHRARRRMREALELVSEGEDLNTYCLQEAR